jgi:tyrosine-protein kinase Etk/Wzc
MSNSNSTKSEKSVLEILHIVYQNKLWILFSILIFILLALVYNQISAPTYEATALLKKEMSDKKQPTSDFYDIIRMQTQDEVETEVELVKTSEVIGEVVKSLNLFINPKKVVKPDGTSIEIKDHLVGISDTENKNIKNLDFSLPIFKNVKVFADKLQKNLYIVKKQKDLFELRNADTNELILTSKSNSDESPDVNIDSSKYSQGNFKDDLWEFDFSWDDAPSGSKFYFTVNDIFSTISYVSSQIGVSKIGKTNVFEISIKSSSPFIAKTIADCLIDKFREARIEQQKQTIRYSFKFVDQQLEEIQGKLLEAENNLSNFKASGQIISIDESSQELIHYLSTLEAEKLSTDLQLSDYKNKAEELEKELKLSGYFDQSYLDPQKSGDINSPFSNLLKEISDLELKRLDLLQKRSENHPDVQNLDQQIKSAKEKLGTYNQNTITAYQILINSLEKKLIKITNLMSRYEVRMQQLPSQESHLARLLRQKDVYEKIFTLLLDKREEMRMAEVSKLQDIVIVDPPQEPIKPIAPNKRLNIIIAIIFGGFIGLLGIFIMELKKSKFIEIDTLEDDTQLPVLAIVPKFNKKIIKRMENPLNNNDKFVLLMESHLGVKESFRLIITKLLFQMVDNEKIILVTSCEENTGKTTVISNLAIALAQEDKKVLLIDADLRKAELTRLFNLSIDTPGLVDALSKEVPVAIYTKVMKKIDILPAGGIREDSGTLLNSERMKLLLESLQTKSEYDYILVDTPPVTRVVDTLVLGLFVKNVLLIVRPNISFKDSVVAGIREMKQAKLKIRGIVANAAEIEKSYQSRYKYGYGYGYGNGHKSGKNGKSNGNLKIFKGGKMNTRQNSSVSNN